MTQGHPRAPATQPKKRPQWMVGGATILTFVALLYLVELIDQLTGGRLDANGIRPLETDGLWGIIFAPVLHANWQHLMANTVPLLVLGFLMTLAGVVPLRLGHGDRVDPGRLRHLADRQHGQQLRPDRSHRGLRPDLRLAGLPAGVRAFRAQGVGHHHRTGRAVRSTAASCSAPCRCSASAVACPGRAICAVRSPASSRRMCCRLRNARPASRKKAGAVRRDPRHELAAGARRGLRLRRRRTDRRAGDHRPTARRGHRLRRRHRQRALRSADHSRGPRARAGHR